MKKITITILSILLLSSFAFAGPKKYSFVPSGEPQILLGKKSYPLLQITKFEKDSENFWIIEGFFTAGFTYRQKLSYEKACRAVVSFGENSTITLKKFKNKFSFTTIPMTKKVPFSKTFTLKTTPVSGLIWLETYDPSKEPKEPIEPSTWQSF